VVNGPTDTFEIWVQVCRFQFVVIGENGEQ
jgi:hypothetical protein